MSTDEKIFYTSCPGWGDHEYCAIKTIVKDGKIVRTEHADYTGPDAKQGFICQKGLTAGRQPYLPGRLLHPLKRVGERGGGKWEQISWDQAMDEIGAKLVELRDKYGPESLALWNLTASVPPSLGLGYLLSNRFMNAYGATDPLHGYGIDNGPLFASYIDFGHSIAFSSYDPNLIALSKYIIVWGANPIENQMRISRNLIEAQCRGAKVVDIGLVFDGTAGKADWFIPIKPGSDAALALCMANIIVSENLYERDFMVKYTVAPFLVRCDNGQFLRDSDNNYLIWDQASDTYMSIAPATNEIMGTPSLNGEYEISGIACKPAFQVLSEHLAHYTPEAQEAITGVPAADAIRLAHEYAAAKPALIMGVLGIRYQNQGEIYRALDLLGALTGNIGRVGGGVTGNLLPAQYPVTFNDAPIRNPGDPKDNKSKIMRTTEFFEAVKTGKPYPIKALLKIAGNPVHNCPNRGRWIKETFPNLELIVDYDIWMTDTSEYSDYVLPDCTPFERYELVSSACYNHVVLQEPAIEPLGEAKDPSYLFRELAKRVGLGDLFDKTAEEWLEIRVQSQNPLVKNIQPPLTMERLKAEKRVRVAAPDRPNDPFAARRFFTASGRIEFYAEQLADMNEAIAIYRPALEVNNEVKLGEFPFQFFTGRQRFFMQSMFSDDPWMVKLSGDHPTARMNPADAEKVGIHDMDMIECYNERGRVQAPVRLDEAIPPGTVQVWFGWRARHYETGAYSELLVPLSGPETIDDLARRWWDLIISQGRIGSYFTGGETPLTGAWDTLWDCLCDVRKVNGGQE